VFKFVTRGNESDFDAGIFCNGQKLIHIYMSKHFDSIEVIVKDGMDNTIADWEDFLEESD
jgi:hypothetical protein